MSQAGILNAASSNPGIPTDFVTDSGTAIPVANTLDILGGSGITTSAVGNTITITAIGSEFSWVVVTSSSPLNPIQIDTQTGYICDGSSLVTFLLPLAPVIGDSFIIMSNTSRFKVTENGAQQICIGTAASTAGSGNCQSNSVGDYVEMVYMGGNVFRSFAPQGTITVDF